MLVIVISVCFDASETSLLGQIFCLGRSFNLSLELYSNLSRPILSSPVRQHERDISNTEALFQLMNHQVSKDLRACFGKVQSVTKHGAAVFFHFLPNTGHMLVIVISLF